MSQYQPGVTYQTPYGQYTPQGKMEPTAVIALMLAISSFFFWIIPAIVALALAPTAKRKIKESNSALRGDGVALAAQIISVVSLFIAVIAVLILFAV